MRSVRRRIFEVSPEQLLELVDPYSTWLDPAFHSFTLPKAGRLKRLEMTGLVQGEELSSVGRWLLETPGVGIWTLGPEGRLLTDAPLKCIWRVFQDGKLKWERNLSEQLAWLLVEPQFYRQRWTPPHIMVFLHPFEPVEMRISCARSYLQWLVLKGSSSPICKTMQLSGMIKHSRMQEFWEEARPIEHKQGDRERTVWSIKGV